MTLCTLMKLLSSTPYSTEELPAAAASGEAALSAREAAVSAQEEAEAARLSGPRATSEEAEPSPLTVDLLSLLRGEAVPQPSTAQPSREAFAPAAIMWLSGWAARLWILTTTPRSARTTTWRPA